MTRRPNFFIIGAAKCGTTSLHFYLDQHPDVFLSEPKEPGFFVPELTYYPKEESWYLGLFEGAGDATFVGESSTHYTKLPTWPGVAERVRAYAPDARMVYLMRDPIDRAISHYWHNARKFEEALPLLKAIRSNVEYKAFGDYAMQLEPWFETFGRERILVLVFEEMVADPRGTVDRVVEWLGLPPLEGKMDLEKRNARPDEVTRARGRGIINRFRYSDLWEAISSRVPQGLKDAAKELALETVRPSTEPVDEVVEELRPWARERIAVLSELLGRDFPRWTTSLRFPAETPS